AMAIRSGGAIPTATLTVDSERRLPSSDRARHGPAQPRVGHPKVVIHRVYRPSQYLRAFFSGHANRFATGPLENCTRAMPAISVLSHIRVLRITRVCYSSAML